MGECETAACEDRADPQYHDLKARLVYFVARDRSAMHMAGLISASTSLSNIDWLFQMNQASTVSYTHLTLPTKRIV